VWLSSGFLWAEQTYMSLQIGPVRYVTQGKVAMPSGYKYEKKSCCGFSNQFVSVYGDTAGKEIHIYFKTKICLFL
jgi:hypothetical protein